MMLMGRKPRGVLLCTFQCPFRCSIVHIMELTAFKYNVCSRYDGKISDGEVYLLGPRFTRDESVDLSLQLSPPSVLTEFPSLNFQHDMIMRVRDGCIFDPSIP